MIGVPQLSSRLIPNFGEIFKINKLNDMHVLLVQLRTNTFIDTADLSYVLVKPLMEHDTVCLVLITLCFPALCANHKIPRSIHKHIRQRVTRSFGRTSRCCINKHCTNTATYMVFGLWVLASFCFATEFVVLLEVPGLAGNPS